MDCALAQIELVPYHFGQIEDGERTAVEQHLLGCASCLRDYLALKREIETVPSDGPQPSRAAKARLRAAVAAELAAHQPRLVRSRWERPLAFAMAGATVWSALFVLNLLATSPGAAPHGLPTQAQPTIER